MPKHNLIPEIWEIGRLIPFIALLLDMYQSQKSRISDLAKPLITGLSE